MTHHLVNLLHFTRGEFRRCLAGVSAEEALVRFGTMNSLGWIVGHLASQEDAYWNYLAQGAYLERPLKDLVGFGSQPNTPPLAEMWAAWERITAQADAYLDLLTPDIMVTHFILDGKMRPENIGTMLTRNLLHYWFHLGEAYAIRQMLGHSDLPTFVGSFAGYEYLGEDC